MKNGIDVINEETYRVIEEIDNILKMEEEALREIRRNIIK